jgi:Domain of unknown function (DUF4124)
MTQSGAVPWSRIGVDANTISRIALFAVTMILWATATAQTEIHKCTDADGGIVYSQLPCTTQKPVEPEKAAQEEKTESSGSESTEQEVLVADDPQETAETEASRAACQKPIRDEIDAIDAEILREYTAEKADHYKQKLLELTRRLRQC